MSYDNSIGIEDDINSMLSNITNEKKKQKRDAYIIAEKLSKGKCYKEDFDQINDIMLDINCNACNSKNIAEINGFYVCQDCGLCNDCIIDSGQEWRFYGADENKGSDPSRCDIPTNELLPEEMLLRPPPINEQVPDTELHCPPAIVDLSPQTVFD